MSGARRAADPFALVKEELDSVSNRLRRTVLTSIPRLGQAAEYFFQLGSEGNFAESSGDDEDFPAFLQAELLKLFSEVY